MKKFLIILLIFILTIKGFAQYGKINGHIYDTEKKENLAYANIKILGTQIRTHTDTNGNFKIDSLADGVYDIYIKYIGYKDTTIQKIKIFENAEINLRINFPPPYVYKGVSKRCPKCGRKNNVIPIVYGLPSSGMQKKERDGKVRLGGCKMTGCDPTWYCKGDQTIH